MRPNWITCLMSAGILLVFSVLATAQDVQHGRISYVDNDGLIRGGGDAEWSVAQQNSLVMPGDTIWADEEGVLEVEVSGGTFMRLADGSKMDVVAMPPTTHIKGWSGSFYIHRLRHSEGDVTLETPVGRIVIERNSQVRIDVLDEGSTTVSTRWGTALIHAEDGLTVRVPTGQQVFIDPGYAPSTPVGFDRNIEDAFDTWNRERSRRIAQGSSSKSIGQVGTYAAPIGTSDLEEYGEWVNVDSQRYWRPTVTNYVPYRTGSWSYVPNHGHVWVGHHPFTYVTSHHGYWRHHHSHGWIWSYHQTYSPAYVASVRFNDNFIWAPLSIHGDAVHLSGSYFTAGGFHFSIGYSSYTHSNYILSGHHNSIYAMNHHQQIQHHRYYDANHWNVYESGSRHYRNRPHRIARSNERHYRPQRSMRGPSEVRLANGNAYSASHRVARLEGRTSRREFSSIAMKPQRGTHRTPTQLQRRQANTRTVAFNEDPVRKMTRRDERVRSARVIPTAPVLTNRGSRRTDDAAAPSISTRGPRQPQKPLTTRGIKPTDRPSSRTINPRGPSESPRDNNAQERRVDTPKQPTQRPRVQPKRPRSSSTRDVKSPKMTLPSRRPVTTPSQTRSQPRSTTPRQQTMSPRQPTISRPQATTSRPSRPQATPQPRVNAPRRSVPQPSVSRPSRQSSPPSRPQVSTPRPQAAPQPRVNAPRRSVPQPSVSRPSRPSPPPSRSSSNSGSSRSSEKRGDSSRRSR